MRMSTMGLILVVSYAFTRNLPSSQLRSAMRYCARSTSSGVRSRSRSCSSCARGCSAAAPLVTMKSLGEFIRCINKKMQLVAKPLYLFLPGLSIFAHTTVLVDAPGSVGIPASIRTLCFFLVCYQLAKALYRLILEYIKTTDIKQRLIMGKFPSQTFYTSVLIHNPRDKGITRRI